ncbi:MAG: hypothetical protein KJ734_00290, partial [Chloroflexi bacterium]|nr:hypothetical protein [Chloroflexota bacterium]
PELWNAGLSFSTLDIQLAGDLITLRDLAPQSVIAYVDVTGLEAGTYPIAPSIIITPTMPVTVLSTDPGLITVTITAK